MTLRSGTICTLATLATLAVLTFDCAAFAGEVSAVINGKSHHINSSEDWNENNYGLGVEYQFDTQSKWKKVVMANGFRDSDENMSYMAGGGIHRNLFSSAAYGGMYVDVGLNAFLMTRDDVNDGRPFPGALPSLTIGNRVMGFNLTYLPEKAVEQIRTGHTPDDRMRGILFVQFKLNVTELMGVD